MTTIRDNNNNRTQEAPQLPPKSDPNSYRDRATLSRGKLWSLQETFYLIY
jgi:hypothetical protein